MWGGDLPGEENVLGACLDGEGSGCGGRQADDDAAAGRRREGENGGMEEEMGTE